MKPGDAKSIENLFNDIIEAGYHSLKWDASYNASGIYFVKIVSEDFIKTKKMTLLK